MSTENENEIPIEEEPVAEKSQSASKTWTEEIAVAGSELVDLVKKLIHETAVRRLVIKNEARNIHFEVPLAAGLAGIVVVPAPLSVVALLAALVTDCTITVERAEKTPEPVEEVEVA